MKGLRLAWGAILAVLTVPPPALPQTKDGPARLPISRIVLFSSGVGYFQRDGQVEGNARVDLHFPTNDINDLLKSLTLQDLGGGQVGTVSYDNRNPLAMTLKSFAIDLTQNPSLGELLIQVRGERVEIARLAASRTQPGALTGVIVGVEKQKHSVGKDLAVDVEQLNILTKEGLRSLALAQVREIRFLKPELDQEFRKALEALATGHDKQKKTVSLNFTGQGKRPVRVGYVTESPVWKTSYRLDLQNGKITLQAWAIVENTTDEDWKDVRLALISGRPISFRMDLYQPLFAQRPLVELELFASLRPPGYAGNLQEELSKEVAPSTPPMPTSPARLGGGRLEDRDKAKSAAKRSLMLDGGGEMADRRALLGEGVASAATAAELGEFFQYAIKERISLARQKSALIPIIQSEVSGSRVSIYNESVQPKFPLLGLRLSNTTPSHLAQGPVTVFDADSYAGDARITDMQPKETRLLSYAIDLGTEVEPKKTTVDSLNSVKIVKGILHLSFKLRETKSYTVKNRSAHARTVLIEHPYRSDFRLVLPKKAAERSREVYRFELTAEPTKPVTLDVVEELPRVEQISLTNLNDDGVQVYIRSTAVSDAVKKALGRALELKAKVNASLQDKEVEEHALKQIEQDQVRMRVNMQRLPPTSEAYKRYLKKFDEQEPDIEKRQARITKLVETAQQQRKAYEEFLASLNVD